LNRFHQDINVYLKNLGCRRKQHQKGHCIIADYQAKYFHAPKVVKK